LLTLKIGGIMITRLPKVSLIGIIFIFTTCSSLFAQCPPNDPIVCEAETYGNGGCCSEDYPICCSPIEGGGCCDAEYPICCSDDYCYKDQRDCPSCPSGVALNNDKTKLEVLRETRDTRLTRTARGQSLIDLYYKHSEEISDILLTDRDLQIITANVVNEIVEKALSLNNNEKVTIDRGLVKSILEVANLINKNASPNLRIAIKKVKKEIKRGTIFRKLGITIRE
jgi:hypothetical protein